MPTVSKVSVGALPLLESWLSAPMLLLGLLDAELVLALPLEAGLCCCDALSKMPQLLAMAAAVPALSPASTQCSALMVTSENSYTARHAPLNSDQASHCKRSSLPAAINVRVCCYT